MSLSSETIWSVAGIGWLTYGVLTNSLTLMASGTFAALGSLALAALLWGHKTDAEKRSALVLTVVTGVGLGGATAVADLKGLSLALSIFGVVQFLPQFTETVQALVTTKETPAVSVVGSSLRALYTGGWAFYAGAWIVWGMSTQEIDWPLVAWGAAGAVTFGLQAWAARRGRSTEPAGRVRTAA